MGARPVWKTTFMHFVCFLELERNAKTDLNLRMFSSN